MKKKSVFKEILIALLLCLVILLVLALVLYNYVPSRKTLPEKVAYTMPQSVSQELIANEGIDDSKVVMTYEVAASDIQTYENTIEEQTQSIQENDNQQIVNNKQIQESED